MKITFSQILHLALMALLCASCSHKKTAPIVNHTKSVYGKSSFNKNKYGELKNKGPENNKNKSHEPAREALSSGQVEVSVGDTLYSISKKYQTPLRDIIEANNLSAPYILKTGTHIIIPKPTYYKVQSGDTLYSVSRNHQMNINDIVALNDLKPPYQLNSGQLLKVKNGEIASGEKKSPTKIEASKQETASAEGESKKPALIEKILENKNNKFSWPIKGTIISKFGPKKGGLYNDGINIKAKEGAPVKASEDGLIAYVGNELKGYGNLIIIKHSGGWITAYAHLSQTAVKRGDKIKKGQSVGTVGSTGNVDSSQLYFGLRKGRDAVNPESYLIK